MIEQEVTKCVVCTRQTASSRAMSISFFKMRIRELRNREQLAQMDERQVRMPARLVIPSAGQKGANQRWLTSHKIA